MNTLTSSFRLRTRSMLVLLAVAITLIAALLVIFQTAAAQEGAAAAPEAAPTNPIHPAFALLDSDRQNVLNSGNAVSTMKTCGECHDTDFITTHSFHTDVGLSAFGSDTASKTHTWDQGTGQFGQWDPLTYRYLSSQGDTRVDMTTAEWIKVNGARHAGGGPAEISREGQPLTSLAPDAANVEASIIDSTGAASAWNWQQSGTVEMNCFLCHTANPNNDARIKALKLGQFRWASTATLLNTGLVTQMINRCNHATTNTFEKSLSFSADNANIYFFAFLLPLTHTTQRFTQ